MLDFLVSENAFNPKSIREVSEIQQEINAERNELLILGSYYDKERYQLLEMILKSIADFSEKYMVYSSHHALDIEKEKIQEKKKNLKKERAFVKETVEHFIKRYGTKIVPEIYKIGKQLNEDMRRTINRLYELEQVSGIYISDIAQIIGYKEHISISEMLYEIG